MVIMLSFGKMSKIFSVILLLVGSSLMVITNPQLAESSLDQAELPTDWPSVYFCNGTVCNEPFGANVGDTITIALVVFNLTDNVIADPESPEGTCPLGNLNGIEVQFSWNPSVLKYVGHTVTVPWEDYPTPVPSSPYPGILHEEAFKLVEKIDENASIPNAEPGTMAWFSYSIMPGAQWFIGNGTFFTMTFNVIERGSSLLKLIKVNLSGTTEEPGLFFNPRIPRYTFDGLFETVGAPTANFTFYPDVGVLGKPVTFNASASYGSGSATIVSYTWNFGDGNVTTVSYPVIDHLYNHTGDYSVSLTVEDSDGVQSSPKMEEVRVVTKRNVKIDAITLTPADMVRVNITVDIAVRVSNDGRVDENSTVRAYYNATLVNFADISTTNWTLIGEENVGLPMDSQSTRHFSWNTTEVPQVDTYYYILANMTSVPYEENLKDNNMTSAPILVSLKSLRDVRAEALGFGWMNPDNNLEFPVLDSETTSFQITVRNAGTENETAVEVMLYCNGSLLRNWTESIPYGENVELTYAKLLDPGSYNVTAVALVDNDLYPDNSRKEGILRVIRRPQLNFTRDPETPYVNQTVVFDASASFHRESGASITYYSWRIVNQYGTTVATLAGLDRVNTTYRFDSAGEGWRVILSIKDSYNIEYNHRRSATSAYQIDARFNVRAPAGFPTEYIILIIVVIVVAALVAIIFLRRRTKA
jgi:PKD repeat protein